MTRLNGEELHGPIAWMAKNHVTANVLMIVLLLGGLFTTTRIKKEVFPGFDLDIVTVSVSYPGSSPEEVEQGIVLAIEEAVRGIAGIKEVESTASEGSGSVTIELNTGVDTQKVYQDIDQAVARIVTFPEESEQPQVSLAAHRKLVLQLSVSGDVDELVLRHLADEVRDRLLATPGITQVDLDGVRDLEIHVEIPQENLRVYDLTLDDVASTISAAALELPGGSVRTSGGEILLRVKERRDWADEFAELPVLSSEQGTVIRLKDIGTVSEGFEEANVEEQFNGYPAVRVAIYASEDETPLSVAAAVDEALVEIEETLPPGIEITNIHDLSDMYSQRLGLLLKNGFLGLALVLVILGLFLDLRLAFWVTMGIPVSFLGGLLFLPWFDVSLNMISMFAFIVALGIVVDDAIVAGENIYEYRRRGMRYREAAIRGARDVAVPITFSILTTIVAFLPLAFIPGIMGKIWTVIPLVVITVFAISWVEALFILPAHLSHDSRSHHGRFEQQVGRYQVRVAERLQRFIQGPYSRLLHRALRHRAVTVATALLLLMIVLAYAVSGRMGFELMPKVESDYAIATAVLPYGAPADRVRAVRDTLVKAAMETIEDHGGDQLSRGVGSNIDENQIEVTVYLTPPEMRPMGTTAFSSAWRTTTGSLPGLEMLRFESDRGGPGSGAALTVELTHSDIEVLDAASAALAERLAEFSSTTDIDDGYSPGKDQIDFSIRPEGQALGLTASEIGSQLRSAFYGVQALRQQRGRDEVRLLVRLPEEQRINEADIENLLIKAPTGAWVPLMEVAEAVRGSAYTTITRRDGRRTVSVTCNIDPDEMTSTVRSGLEHEVLPQLAVDYHGLTYSFQGRQADMRESLQSLVSGFALALLASYALLAIPFKSYAQPLIVMMSIPFGVVGAVLGHLLMGYSLGVISMMGIVALSGVVINDALVLIDYANRLHRDEGIPPFEAVLQAGMRRFRPILLTTVTTFGGLAPMIFETSRQARFMIPMALSLGFGILFATAITLVLVPCLYLMLYDLLGIVKQGVDDDHYEGGIVKPSTPESP